MKWIPLTLALWLGCCACNRAVNEGNTGGAATQHEPGMAGTGGGPGMADTLGSNAAPLVLDAAP